MNKFCHEVNEDEIAEYILKPFGTESDKIEDHIAECVKCRKQFYRIAKEVVHEQEKERSKK